LTTRRRWRRVGTVTFLLGVLAIVAVAAFGGTAAAAQSAPDCNTVSYDQNADGAYLVTNESQLQCVANMSTAPDRNDDYVVTQDIDASNTSNWNGNLGFKPIANGTTFNGTFDGGGHTISGLFIQRAAERQVGLFSVVGAAGEVTDTNLVGVDVTGDGDTGSLVGDNEGTVSNSTAAGAVSGDADHVGGLVGYNDDGSVTGSEADVSVAGNSEVGGLVGWNDGSVSQSLADGGVTGGSYTGGLVGENDGTISASQANGSVDGTGSDYEIAGLAGRNDGSISRSRATGDVTAPDMDDVAGLVGDNSDGSIVESSASGAVTGEDEVGGLVGNNDAPIRRSFATGTVDGTTRVGGLAGDTRDDGPISDSYATGDVNGSTTVGGLVGRSGDPESVVERSYSTGAVTGDSNLGGLVGYNAGTVQDGYWDTETSGQSSSAGGTGLPTANMTGDPARSNMTGLAFGSTWGVNASYPFLCGNPFDDPCSTDDDDEGEFTVSNYKVTAEGDRIVVTFDSDENLVEIDVRISGAETANLTRDDFGGDVYEGFRATYTAGTNGQYDVALVSAKDSSNEDAVDRPLRASVRVTGVATPTPTPTATPTAAPTATATPSATPTATSPPDTDTPTPETDTDTATTAVSPATETGTDGDGPGFGLWIAVAALVAAAALRRRRGGDA
jgi:PGF-CTERM protein